MDEEKLGPETMIANLRSRFANLKPGDIRRLDVCAAIQSIEGDIQGGNEGHARYLADKPEARQRLDERIRRMYKKLMTD